MTHSFSRFLSRQLPIVVLAPGTAPTEGGIQAVAYTTWRVLADTAPVELLVLGNAGSAGGLGVFQTQTKWKLAAHALARRWDAEVVLVHHIGLLKIIPFLRGFYGNVVLFLHGIEVWRPLGWLTCRLLGRVDHFLTNSQHTWDRFLTFQPQLAGAHHTVVPLGIGSPLTVPTPPPDAIPAALILGRMARGEDYKGHRELIAAWPRVRDRVPAAELWVAGDGDLRPDLENLAQRIGVGGAIRFLGRVTEEQKHDLLVRSRCLAMPSRGEGFGLVYLEAMRVGRPCLVSDQDAGREVVNPPEAGLAADPGASAALASAVVELLTPGPRWEAWSRAARERYESRFTAVHFGRRLLDALHGTSTV